MRMRRALQLSPELEADLDRMVTSANLSVAVRKHGVYHPATYAAIGRAHRAWAGIIRPPKHEDRQNAAALSHAYTTSQLRALGAAGWANRRYRRWVASKLAALRAALGSRPSQVNLPKLRDAASEAGVRKLLAPQFVLYPDSVAFKGV